MPLRGPDLCAVYLTGQRVYLRALLLSDKDHAAAWFPSPYPANATRAEEFLKEVHNGEEPRTRYFAIVRRDGDEIVGSVKLWTDYRRGELYFQMAPALADADELRGEALELAVRWLRDDFELMTVGVEIAADQPASLAAAERAGMRQTVRLREHIARGGRRVDQLWFQALNPRWALPADGEEAAGA